MTLLMTVVSSSVAIADSDLVFSGLVPVAVKEQMQTDLRLLQDMKGQDATPIFRQMFAGAFSGATLYDFFKARIKAVGMDDCDGPLMAACVIHSLSRTTLFLTESYSKFDMPQVFRVSILLHESRHTEAEGHFWMHAKCPRPFRDWKGQPVISMVSHAPLDGQPACDQTAYGAYGLQAEFLKNTEMYCENCNEKVKLDAKIFGTDTVRRISNPAASAEIRRDLKI